MLKTLMALVDRKPVCVIVPSDREVSMKKLGTALDGKSAQMMRPADAERISGYNFAERAFLIGNLADARYQAGERTTGSGHARQQVQYGVDPVGGISPFGQTRKLQIVIEAQALVYDLIYINGSQRGLQVRLKPRDVISLFNFVSAPVIV